MNEEPTTRRRRGRPRKPNGAANGERLDVTRFGDDDDAPRNRAAAEQAVRDGWSRLFHCAKQFAAATHVAIVATAEMEQAEANLSNAELALSAFPVPAGRRRKRNSRRASVSPADEREADRG